MHFDYSCNFANDLRGSMMKFFFPASHRNMKKTPCLKAGQTRVPTAIKIYIEFLSQITIRVPLREASKVAYPTLIRYMKYEASRLYFKNIN